MSNIKFNDNKESKGTVQFPTTSDTITFIIRYAIVAPTVQDP